MPEAAPPFAKPHRTWLPALLSGGVLVLTMAGLVWYGHSVAGKTARLSTLLVLQSQLNAYAAEHGRYPRSCEEAVDSPDFLRNLDPDSIVYCAAGMKARGSEQAAGDRRLFYEKAARRYGFSRGWFEVFEIGWSFHEGVNLANETAPSPPAWPGREGPEVGGPSSAKAQKPPN